MAEILEVKNIGLRGVKVADTRISDVDGEKGCEYIPIEERSS